MYITPTNNNPEHHSPVATQYPLRPASRTSPFRINVVKSLRLHTVTFLLVTLLVLGLGLAVIAAHKPDFVAASEIVSTKLRKIAKLTGASIIDPINSFCNELICLSTMPDGEPIYSDADHIRPFFAMEYLTFLDQTILKR